MKLRFRYPGPSAKPYLVLGIALFLAVGAMVQLLWRELVRRRAPPSCAEITGAGHVVTPKVTSPAVFLQPETAPVQALSNLFHSTFVDRTLLKLAKQKEAQEAAQEAARKAAQAQVVEKAARLRVIGTRPKAGSEKVVVKLLPPPVRFSFQGLIRTDEGGPLALLSIVPTGRSSPFAAGEVCHGAVVTNVAVDHVDLILNDGSIRRVERGISEPILEGLLHAP